MLSKSGPISGQQGYNGILHASHEPTDDSSASSVIKCVTKFAKSTPDAVSKLGKPKSKLKTAMAMIQAQFVVLLTGWFQGQTASFALLM